MKNKCFMNPKKIYSEVLATNSNININDIVLDKDKLITSDEIKNINYVLKLRRISRSLWIRKIHVYVFSLITLILCIAAISLLGAADYNFSYISYINDSYIIFGVAFGTFLVAILFTIISATTIKKIFRRARNNYEILDNLMEQNILSKDLNNYSIGIQMAYSSRYVWNSKENNTRWSNIYIIVSIAILFDKLKEIK